MHWRHAWGPKRRAKHGQTQRLQNGLTLLAGGRDVAADATEDGGALAGAEAPRHLLFEFDHAQVALGLIVVERDVKIVHES